MDDSTPEAITFPANPFVALADFIMVLMVILILSIVHQSLSSSSLLERAAVDSAQQELRQHIETRIGKSSGLTQTHVDGDLQRFLISGHLSFRHNSAEMLPESVQLLHQFGDEIAAQQGTLQADNSRPFKRIIVEGHADAATEKNAQGGLWGLSMRRAQAAVMILEQECHIYPKLLEASGRGGSIPLQRSPEQSAADAAEANHRLQLIIVYSGKVSMTYLMDSGKTAPPSR